MATQPNRKTRPLAEAHRQGQKVVRNIRITVQTAKKLDELAAKDGLPVAEFLRRIIDIHLVRGEFDHQISERVLGLEQRSAGLEQRMAELVRMPNGRYGENLP